MDLDRANNLIAFFGSCQKTSMRAERRDTMKSVLFDLPRRSSLGWEVLYEHGVGFLRELSEHVTAEELGRRMRTIGSRPYSLQPFILMCSYLGARQQHMLDAMLGSEDSFPDEDFESMAYLLDFWERLQRSYRTDGTLLPQESGGRRQILDDAMIAEVLEHVRGVSADEYASVRRTAATLELYSFILHGEQRDGITGHGPYPLEDGSILFFREFNDLQNDYLPWSATTTRNLYPNVVVAYVAHDVQVECDMFGGIMYEPHELGDRLEGIAMLTNDGGAITSIIQDNIAIQEAAAEAQTELYMKAVGWDDRYRIAYGGPLFANHLKPFFDLAGVGGDVGQRIMDACQGTADRLVAELLDSDVASVWTHMGTTEGDFFWAADG